MTVTDANGCTADANNLVIDEEICTPPPVCEDPIIEDIVVVEENCGASNGLIEISMVGGNAGYTFEWAAPINGTGPTQTGLVSGSYTVTITDAGDASCFIVQVIPVGNVDGPVTDDPVVTPATCELADGSITITPANYLYQWNQGLLNGNVQTNVPAGQYVVTVTNPAAPACPNVIEVEVPATNPLTVTFTSTDATCGESNGSLTANVSGGSGNYAYDWGSFGSTATITGLASGSYPVTITDLTWGCELTDMGTVLDIVANPADIVVTNAPVMVSCVGSTDGTVEFDATAGFTTVIVDGTGNVVANGTLGAGSYTIEATDADGCLAGEATFMVEEPSLIDVDIEVLPETCDANDNVVPGSIMVTTTGGTPPYTWNWSNLNGNNNPESQPSLTAGTYSLTVTDANGCTADANNLVVAPADCPGTPCEEAEIMNIVVVEENCGESNGSIEVNLVQNEADYTFTWAAPINTTGSMQSNLSTGTYTVTITNNADASCPIVEEIPVGNVEGPVAGYQATPATCDLTDGSVTLTPASYTYEWDNLPNGAVQNNLPAGDYNVTVIDPVNTDCPNVIVVNIPEMNPLSLDFNMVNPDCGVSNGSLTAVITGGTGNYTFAWSPSGSGATLTNLPSGLYNVTVTDNITNCVIDGGVTLMDDVANPATITVSNNPVMVSCIGSSDGTVVFDVLPAGLNTMIVDAATNIEATNGNLSEGNYCIITTDIDGCITGQECFEVIEPSLIDIDIEIIDETCDANNNVVLGSITVTTTGGTPPYTWNWSNLNGSENPQSQPTLGAGTYSLIVTDDNGCIADATNLVIEAAPDCDPTCNPNITNVSEETCDDCAPVCLEIPLDEVQNYVITLDDVEITAADFVGCNYDTMILYSYFTLLGMGDQGPYDILGWTVNGTVYTGLVNNPQELTDFLNANDPAGNWILDAASYEIEGGTQGSTYGDILVQNLGGFMSFSNLGANIGLEINGTAVCVEAGSHVIEIFDVNDTSCALEQINVNVTTETCYTPDTVTLVLPVNTDNSANPICFDAPEMELTGTLTYELGTGGTTDTGSFGSWTLNPTTGCLVYTAGNAPGTEPNPIVIIVTNENGETDTLVVNVTVTPEDCPDVTPTVVNTVDCENCTPVCLDIPFDMMGGYTVNLDGTEYTGAFDGCDVDSVYAFNYTQLLNAGASGPYTLDSWVVGGQVLNGTFNDPQGLEDLMNNLDPTGNWELMSAGSVILGGDNNNTYSIMQVTNDLDGTPATLGFNFLTMAMGTSLCVEPGDHIIEVIDNTTGCPDEVINVVNIGCDTDPDTVVINVPVFGTDGTGCFVDVLTPNVTYTLDLNDIPNTINSTTGQDNENGYGSWTLDANGCLIYTANGVTGNAVDYITIIGTGSDGVSNTTVVIVNIFEDTPPEPDTVVINVPVFGTDGTGCFVDVLTPNVTYTLDLNDIPNTINSTTGQDNENGYGSWTLDANGCLIYTANGVTGNAVDYITIIGTGSDGVSNTTVVIVNIFEEPEPPVDTVYITVPIFETDGTGCFVGTLPGTVNYTLDVTDPDNTSPTTGADATYGSWVLNTTTGCLEYTANGVIGNAVDYITIIGDDGNGNITGTTVVVVNIIDVIIEFDTLTIDVPANTLTENAACFSGLDTPPLSGTITYTFVATDVNGNTTGTITTNNECIDYEAFGNVGFNMDMITITAMDDNNLVDETTIIVNIIPTPDSTEIVVQEGETVTDIVCFTEFEPGFANGGPINYTLCSTPDPTIGTYTVGPDGCLTYTANDLNNIGIDIDEVCISACNSDGLCDTLLIDVTIIPSQDTVIINVPTFGSDDTGCFVQDDLTGQITFVLDATDDGMSDFGTWNLNDTDGCITYDAGDTEGNGVDTIFIYGTEDGTGLMDTTIIIVNIFDPTMNDTIFVTLPTEDSITACFDNSELDINNPIDYNLLDANTTSTYGSWTLDPVTGCITYNSDVTIGSFVDTICIEGIDATGLPDTTCIIVSITPVCDTLFTPDMAYAQLSDCSATLAYCLPIPAAEVGGYTVVDNLLGTTYDPATFGACDVDSLGVAQGSSIDLPIGTHELIFTDTLTGCMDTMTVNVLCIPNEEIVDTIFVDDMVTLCLDTFQLPGNVESITNLLDNDNDYADFIIDDVNYCVTYVGDNSTGTDTACVIICDDLGLCDTTKFYITVIPENCGLDTINLTIMEGDILDYELALDSCLNSLDTIFNYCEDDSGTNVIVTLNEVTNDTVSFEGITVGQDTACIVVCDTMMNTCDTTIFIVDVMPNPTCGDVDTVLLDLTVDEIFAPMFDLDPCVMNPDTIFNYCEDASGSSVVITELELDPGPIVEFEGFSPGQDTACIVVCDTTTNECDTTIYIITVTEDCIAPIAVNDTLGTITIGSDITYGVVDANDTLFCDLTDIMINDQPMNGTVIITDNDSIIYTPNPDFCGETDSFTYIICNEVGCDEATVYVDVICDDLVIFNGFSPNGDDVNDLFVIEGLENFPENNLCIFNRWGNQVYLVDDYQNNWDGTWDGKPLPDGTYFYILSYEAVDENGQPTTKKIDGFVQIHR